MDISLVIVAVLVGLALGAVGGALLTRRLAPGAGELTHLKNRLDAAADDAAQIPALTARLAAERESHARALQAAERAADERSDLERAAFERERVSLQADVAAERERSVQRLAEMRADAKRMSDEFEALSAKVLAQTQEIFFKQAEERFGRAQEASAAELAKREQAVRTLVEPLTRTLTEVKSGMDSAEKSRAEAHATLAEQVTQMRADSEYLRQETSHLVTALRAPQVRGRWGELQLRRVVEAAGMVEHVDFTEQETLNTDDGVLRPDMVVTLPGGKQVVVDAKVAFSGYLEAMEATEEAVRHQRLKAHARHVRTHMDSLGAKAYWEHLDHTPEFVVMFLPAEPFLQAALEQEPGLLERAFEQNVVLATPATLVALLRTVAYTWRQERLAEDAEQVFSVGRELHKRLGTLGKHLTTLGKRLNSTVEAYNSFNRSLDQKVVVQARRFSSLQGLEPNFDSHPPLDVLAIPAQKPDVYQTPQRDEAAPIVASVQPTALSIEGFSLDVDPAIETLVEEANRDAHRASESPSTKRRTNEASGPASVQSG